MGEKLKMALKRAKGTSMVVRKLVGMMVAVVVVAGVGGDD